MQHAHRFKKKPTYLKIEQDASYPGKQNRERWCCPPERPWRWCPQPCSWPGSGRALQWRHTAWRRQRWPQISLASPGRWTPSYNLEKSFISDRVFLDSILNSVTLLSFFAAMWWSPHKVLLDKTVFKYPNHQVAEDGRWWVALDFELLLFGIINAYCDLCPLVLFATTVSWWIVRC